MDLSTRSLAPCQPKTKLNSFSYVGNSISALESNPKVWFTAFPRSMQHIAFGAATCARAIE